MVSVVYKEKVESNKEGKQPPRIVEDSNRRGHEEVNWTHVIGRNGEFQQPRQTIEKVRMETIKRETEGETEHGNKRKSEKNENSLDYN